MNVLSEYSLQPQSYLDDFSSIVSNENHLKKLKDDPTETLSSYLRNSQKEKSKKESPKKSLDRNYRSISGPAVMVNPTYEITEKTTSKLWKNFESVIKGSMHMGQAQRIKFQENILKNEKNLSPEQKKLLQSSISREKNSIKQAKKVSPMRSSPLKKSPKIERYGTGLSSLLNKDYFNGDKSVNVGASPLYKPMNIADQSGLLSISQHSQEGQDDSELMGIMRHHNNKFKTDNFQNRKIEAMMGLDSQLTAQPNFVGQSYLNAKDEPSFIETFRNQDASHGILQDTLSQVTKNYRTGGQAQESYFQSMLKSPEAISILNQSQSEMDFLNQKNRVNLNVKENDNLNYQYLGQVDQPENIFQKQNIPAEMQTSVFSKQNEARSLATSQNFEQPGEFRTFAATISPSKNQSESQIDNQIDNDYSGNIETTAISSFAPPKIKTLSDFKQMKFAVDSLRDNIIRNTAQTTYMKPQESAYQFALNQMTSRSNSTFSSKQNGPISKVKTVHNMFESQVFSSQTSLSDLHDFIPKFITCEKLLHNQESKESQKLKLNNGYMLCYIFYKIGEFAKVIRHSETLNLDTTSEKVFHLLLMVAESYMVQQEYRKASKVFYKLCKTYNKSKKLGLPPNNHSKSEYGVDDYIRTKASYAECLMNMGQIRDAIDKFESTKTQIENEIIYDNPLIFTNVCNQLANCYLIVQDLPRALDNFESSLCVINRMASQNQISPKILGKICLNIALIRSQLGNHREAVIMHLKAIDYKRIEQDADDELRDQYILLAASQQKAHLAFDATKSVEEALNLQIQNHGEYCYKTSQIMTQVGHSYLKVDKFSKAIKNFEHASMILCRLEQKTPEFTQKLDAIYLLLIDLYLQVQKHDECQSVIQTLEQRLENNSNEYAFGMLNEVANLLRKNSNLELSVLYYRKALLNVKKRYKNEYLNQMATSKILINIATVQYLLENFPEAVKYYKHSLDSLNKVRNHDLLDILQEQGKVRMSFANLFKQLGEVEEAREQFQKAIEVFESYLEEAENDQISKMHLEAMYILKTL